MKNLALIKDMTEAMYTNAMEGDFKVVNALLGAVEAMTDAEFAENIRGAEFEPCFDDVVNYFETRCFVREVAEELVKAFDGENAVIQRDSYDISINLSGKPEVHKGAVLWILSRPFVTIEGVSYGAEFDLGTDYGSDYLLRFEAMTAKEAAETVKTQLDAARNREKGLTGAR